MQTVNIFTFCSLWGFAMWCFPRGVQTNIWRRNTQARTMTNVSVPNWKLMETFRQLVSSVISIKDQKMDFAKYLDDLADWDETSYWLILMKAAWLFIFEKWFCQDTLWRQYQTGTSVLEAVAAVVQIRLRAIIHDRPGRIGSINRDDISIWVARWQNIFEDNHDGTFKPSLFCNGVQTLAHHEVFDRC